MRRFDLIRFRLAAMLLVQLVVGTVVVSIQAQSRETQQAVQYQQLSDRQLALDARMGALESLKIGERLALLDDMRTRIGKIELLAYGLIFTMAGSLVLNLLQIQGQRASRRSPILTPDA